MRVAVVEFTTMFILFLWVEGYLANRSQMSSYCAIEAPRISYDWCYCNC